MAFSVARPSAVSFVVAVLKKDLLCGLEQGSLLFGLHYKDFFKPAFDYSLIHEACDGIDIIGIFIKEAGAGAANVPGGQVVTIGFFVVNICTWRVFVTMQVDLLC
jgi:hypothetical protein